MNLLVLNSSVGLTYYVRHAACLNITCELFQTMRSRDRDVVLVRRIIDPGCWEFGIGSEWGGDGEGEVSIRATWGQG